MDPERQCLFSNAICIGGGKPGWLKEGGIHTVALMIGSTVDACLLTRCEWLHMCFLTKRTLCHNAFARRVPCCLAQMILDFNPALLLCNAEVFTFIIPPSPSPQNSHPILLLREIDKLYHQKRDQVIWLKPAQYTMLVKKKGEGGESSFMRFFGFLSGLGP